MSNLSNVGGGGGGGSVPFEDTERRVYDTHDSKTPVQALIQDYNNIDRMWDDYRRISAAHRLNRQLSSSHSHNRGSSKLGSKEVLQTEINSNNNTVINVGTQGTQSVVSDSEETSHAQSSSAQMEKQQINGHDAKEILNGVNSNASRMTNVGGTITVCDIEPTGFKLERIGMYDEHSVQQNPDLIGQTFVGLMPMELNLSL
ncbi:unnamed protein product [Ambrosiozyma monospora]|uniref:Unnamed protein product n=1 Tax=Ambrosiozyma monospora TaxID=43982 RepID=A0ACB5TQ99_AMBMO|nr:unnamed protein product [Ambrosiozyma monospora]